MKELSRSKLSVIHCDFDQKYLTEITSAELPLFKSKMDISFGSIMPEDKVDECGLMVTFKFKVFTTKDVLVGSYISQQCFYLKFPNDNLEELIADIKWHSIITYFGREINSTN